LYRGHCIKFYRKMGEGIFVISGTEPLSCPICGGDLAAYDRKSRKARTQFDGIIVLLLRRLRCRHCKKLHTELPDFLVPYKRYSRECIEDVLAGSRTGSPDDERTRSKIRRWYQQIRSYLDGIWKRLVTQTFASPKKIPSFLEMVTAAVNSGFWTTHPNGHRQPLLNPVASS